LLETCKATIPAKTYTERAVKLLDSQDTINDLLEELESAQKQLQTESQVMQDKNKNYVKMEQPVSKIKTEHKPAKKSMFHGTSLAASSSTSSSSITCVLETSVSSESSEGSFYDC
jgi:hypothetical protein